MLSIKELMHLQAETYPLLLKGYAWSRRGEEKCKIELLAILPLHDNLSEAFFMSRDHVEYRYFEISEV